MLNLTPRRRRRVSNGLAIFGAFLLAASVLAGVGQPPESARQQAESQTAPALARAEQADPVHQPRTGNSRKFKVSLLLFRH